MNERYRNKVFMVFVHVSEPCGELLHLIFITGSNDANSIRTSFMHNILYRSSSDWDKLLVWFIQYENKLKCFLTY